jgi:protein gp37
MGAKTGIEWCDSTWNPLEGCSRVSEGCRNCYAEAMAGRFCGSGQHYEGLATRIGGKSRWTGAVRMVEKHLLDSMKWKAVLTGLMTGEGKLQSVKRSNGEIEVTRPRRRRIFVNSMSDLFHENVTDEMRDRIFAVMALCPQHDFIVLTKRPERMLRYFNSGPRPSTMTCPRKNHILNVLDFMTRAGECAEKYRGLEITLAARLQRGEWKWPLSNVWLGVSVENQVAADDRVPLLLQTPAAVRFVSCEPLLGPVRLNRIGEEQEGYLDALAAVVSCNGRGTKSITGLDWIICGGESGPGARPMHPEWVRALRDQCLETRVPFFFKQWGAWAPKQMQHIHTPEKVGKLVAMTTICASPKSEEGKVAYWAYPSVVAEGNWGLVERMEKVGRRSAGSLLDECEWKQFPETVL